MDLSPFVFTRNIPPYSPSSGLCVCGCPDCFSTGSSPSPCPIPCFDCFCLGCPRWWCPGCLSCPGCPMFFPCPC